MNSTLDNRLVKSCIFFRFAFGSMHVKIETERLFICSYKDRDFEDCVYLYGSSKITRYFDHGIPRTLSEVKKLVHEKGSFFKKGKPFGLFSIFHKSSKTFIGQIDFLPTDEVGTAEIGFILHEKYHNQGFCTEAVKAFILDYVEEINKTFNAEELPILKIIATVHPKNEPSKKVLEKSGMTLYKIQERFGNPRLWYSIPLQIKYQQVGAQ